MTNNENTVNETMFKTVEKSDLKSARKKAEETKSEVERLKESTSIMDKKRVKIKIKELEDAVKSRRDEAERQKIQVLSDDFEKIYECLKEGEESLNKESLMDKRIKLLGEIKTHGADSLNVAKLNNNKAKIDIIKYEPIIREAAQSSASDDYRVLDKYTANKKTGLFTAVVAGVLVIGIVAAGFMNKVKDKFKANTNNTTTAATTLNDSSSTTTTTNGTTVATTTKFDLETVTVDYSSPTLDTENTNADGYFIDPETGEVSEPDVTYEDLRPTTPYEEVEVISDPSVTDTIETVSYETTEVTQPTDTQGTVAETTEYTAPTGTDELPIEPTVVTVDLFADSEYKEAEATKQSRKKTNSKAVSFSYNSSLNNYVVKKSGKAYTLRLR